MIDMVRSATCLVVLALLSACGAPEQSADDPAAEANTHRMTLLAASCAGCHTDAESFIPSLEGLSRDELAASFRAYRDDAAGETVMHRIARGYSDDHIQSIVTFLVREDGHRDVRGD